MLSNRREYQRKLHAPGSNAFVPASALVCTMRRDRCTEWCKQGTRGKTAGRVAGGSTTRTSEAVQWVKAQMIRGIHHGICGYGAARLSGESKTLPSMIFWIHGGVG